LTARRWSSSAAICGVAITLLLSLPSDLALTGPFGPIRPPMVFVSALIRLFQVETVPTWSLLPLIATCAGGNALWYMLVTETARLVVVNLKRYFAR
jgi:hypothetical protein